MREFQEITVADSVDALRGMLIHFGDRFGFETVSAAVVVDRSPTNSQFFVVANTPVEYRGESEDPEKSRRDPVIRRLKLGNVPVLWDQATYAQAGAGDLWDEMAPYGYRTGIAVALHRLDGHHFLLGYNRREPLPKREKVLTRLVADCQLLAVYAQDAAMRLLLPPAELGPERPLTDREKQVLRWAAQGKSAWDIARILDISESTAIFHTRNAVAKLACTSKAMAAAKAIRLRLL